MSLGHRSIPRGVRRIRTPCFKSSSRSCIYASCLKSEKYDQATFLRSMMQSKSTRRVRGAASSTSSETTATTSPLLSATGEFGNQKITSVFTTTLTARRTTFAHNPIIGTDRRACAAPTSSSCNQEKVSRVWSASDHTRHPLTNHIREETPSSSSISGSGKIILLPRTGAESYPAEVVALMLSQLRTFSIFPT